MKSFDIEKIHQTVWVFKNALKDGQDIIDYLKKDKEWKDWYNFGKMLPLSNNTYEFKNFPTQEEWEKNINTEHKMDEKETEIIKKINTLFYETTSIYVKENNVLFNDWIFYPWGIAEYDISEKNPSNLIMYYHTDFQRELEYNPGIKFGITAVFYLNDNYEGGEVLFRFMEDETLKTIKEQYSYKPCAGDIVVFLSGHPHYHGVASVSQGKKSIIRTYWRYTQEAHPKWLELEKKYGKEKFKEMEKKRIEYTISGKNLRIKNEIPVFINFEEYYKKLENNEI